MSEIKSQTESDEKTCTKCHVKKSLKYFGLVEKGSSKRRAKCNPCRSDDEKERRNGTKTTKTSKITPALIEKSTIPKLHRNMQKFADEVVRNPKLFQSPATVADPPPTLKIAPMMSRNGSPPKQVVVKHEPGTFFWWNDRIANLGKLCLIESRKTDLNSFEILNVKKVNEADMMQFKSKIANAVTGIANDGNIVVTNDYIDVVFYKKVQGVQKLAENAGHSCLVVIRDGPGDPPIQLIKAQKDEIIRRYEL